MRAEGQEMCVAAASSSSSGPRQRPSRAVRTVSTQRCRHCRGLVVSVVAVLLLGTLSCFVQGGSSLRGNAGRTELVQRKATRQKSKSNQQKMTELTIDLEDFDAWEVLDLPMDADKTKIRRRFRKLVATQHPDKRPNDPNAVVKFMRIKKAYEELMGTDSSFETLKKWAEENREWSESAREFLGEEEDTTPPETPVVLYVGLAILLTALGVGTYLSLNK
eukprot:gb/GFBE01079180.1/.p1 GENE.gb/GFBE01079180.1/~~gb/GFBE01079180.1/.p1  ORF type:complete len:219 (+),score=41.80 gb/GFBE01079180.1/:1-657(+)